MSIIVCVHLFGLTVEKVLHILCIVSMARILGCLEPAVLVNLMQILLFDKLVLIHF
jgi:hypothetical protein